MTQIDNISFFYLKRIITIFPLYYLKAITYTIFIDTPSIKLLVLTPPIELLGLQTVFSSLFNFSHNSGSWFISCIFICYLIYPYLQEVGKQIKKKTKIILIFLSALILLVAPLIVKAFEINSIYSNPFFRGLEFLIGILIAYIIKEINLPKMIGTWFAFIIEFLVLIIGVTVAFNLNIGRGNYMLYNWIGLPIFILMLFTLSQIQCKKTINRKILSYLSSISYAFYLVQIFAFKITAYVLGRLCIEKNVIRIITSFLICMLLATLTYELIEKPVSNFLKRKFLKVL